MIFSLSPVGPISGGRSLLCLSSQFLEISIGRSAGMYLVSSRKDFWNNTVISEHVDCIREVNFSTGESEEKVMGDYEALIRNKKVLLLCHGYRNEPDDVMNAYDLIKQNQVSFTNYFDVVAGYTWPGGENVMDYFAAKNRASAVAPRFATLLETTMASCSELAIMSHSMGCRISLIACERLRRENVKKCDKLWQLLMAAAVDNESIEEGERYFDATLFDDSTYVFHSKRDGVLGGGYSLAEWDTALGYSGPENVADIHKRTKVINCKHVVKQHGGYKRTQQVFDYMRQELPDGNGPQFSTLR